MKTRNIVAAVVILIVLAGYLKFFEPKVKTTSLKKLQIGKVFDLPFPGQFESILCRNVTLEKDMGDTSPWRIIRPFAFYADSQIASVLADSIRDLVFEREFAIDDLDEKNIDQMGFLHADEKNILAFSYKAFDGRKTKKSIIFGADTPIGNSCYIKDADAGKIYTISREVKKLFEESSEAYSQKKIFEDLSLQSCKSFSSSIKDEKYTFERKGEYDHLMMKEPFVAFIDGFFFNNMFKYLNSLEISEFTDEKHDFRETSRITWDNNSSVIEVVFSKAEDKVYAQLKGFKPMFTYKLQDLEKFGGLMTMQNMLSKTLTPFDEISVESIELDIKIQKTRVYLKQSGDLWDYVLEDDTISTSYKPKTLAKNLMLVKIKEYIRKEDMDTAVRGFMDLKCTLFSGTNKEFLIKIGIGKNGGLYASLDEKVYAVLEDIDVQFLSSLKTGQVVPEKQDEE